MQGKISWSNKAHSLRPTLQIERSLEGYSHRERCRAPDSSHYKGPKDSFFYKGLEDSSHYKGLEDSSHYKRLEDITFTYINTKASTIQQSLQRDLSDRQKDY